jgi:3-oxoacyl-[acyl-carrier-protein] synthase II
VAAAIVAFGAASALGVGRAAFDVGGSGAVPANAWSSRVPGKPFGRVLGCDAARADRPRALLELGLDQVVAQLDLRDPRWRDRRLGVVLGTSSGGFAALERALEHPDADAATWAKSAYFAPLSGLTAKLGREPNRLVSMYAACASSALAIGLGLRWLELDEVDLVIAGGYDAESDWVCAGFDALKATTSGQPRPFRAERDGMALGEGVGLVALTRAAETGYGFVRGFAATTDAVHITAPDRTGQGLARAVTQALREAALAPAEVDFVSVHGTGTSFNDAAEGAALRVVFAERAAELQLHAFKTVVGHTLGAAAALESLAALSALENQVLPASASPGTPMPELPACLLTKNRPSPVEHCLKLSTAFGGANAALVLSRRDVPSALRARRPVYLVAVGVPCSELDVKRLEGVLVAPLERLPRSDLLSGLAIAASAEALHIAALAGRDIDRARTGVVVGSVGATLQANAEFAVRVLARGREHAEPRRFPGTSPNAGAGHVAIAFGLGGPSHAVGTGPDAALEALAVARDWVAAGDADAMLVVGAEQAGTTASRVLEARGLALPEHGSFAVLLAAAPEGLLIDAAPLAVGENRAEGSENLGFRALEAWARAVGLPGPRGFGSVRPPE